MYLVVRDQGFERFHDDPLPFDGEQPLERVVHHDDVPMVPGPRGVPCLDPGFGERLPYDLLDLFRSHIDVDTPP